LLRQVRVELLAAADEGGFGELREPHLQIFGNVGVEGIRLTDLAARAQLSMAATSDLVSDLQALGSGASAGRARPTGEADLPDRSGPARAGPGGGPGRRDRAAVVIAREHQRIR